MMRKYALRLIHLWFYLDGEQVWAPQVKFLFSQLTSLRDIGSWIKRRTRMSEWPRECRQTLILLSRASNTGNGATTTYFYSGLVEHQYDDVLGEALGFDRDQQINLFERTFGPRCLDKFQKFLALLCYQSTLPVRERLSRHWFNVLPPLPHVQSASVFVKLSRIHSCIVWNTVENDENSRTNNITG